MRSVPSTRFHQPPLLEAGGFSSESMYGGGQEEKHLVTITREGVTHSYVARPYNDNYMRSWRAFLQAGLPVVPELYVTELEGKRMMLTTDLKSNGGELYGMNLNILMWREFPRERMPDTSVDRRFMELTRPSGLDVLRDHAEYYADVATASNLKFARDDAFQLFVGGDLNWSLCNLDLTQSATSHDMGGAALAAWNLEHARESIHHLELVRNNFIAHGMSDLEESVLARPAVGTLISN